ncbi:MAG: dephospho-CoA kinase [Gaiellaceae bacterium]
MPRRPLAVAITGGIGAGKSELLRLFGAHGAATVSSDEIVHELLAKDEEVRRVLVERFGKQVMGAGGEVRRDLVADRVFANPDDLSFLEELLHPRVSAQYLAWRDWLGTLPDPPSVCATEVPLLFEAGSESHFDRVVVVTAPLALRRARAGAAMLDQRQPRLISEREKVRRADFAYVNDGSVESLEAFAMEVMEKLEAEQRAAS